MYGKILCSSFASVDNNGTCFSLSLFLYSFCKHVFLIDMDNYRIMSCHASNLKLSGVIMWVNFAISKAEMN